MKLLSSKIFVGYLLVILILTGLILLFSFQTIRNQYVSSSTANLQNINIALHSQVLYYIDNNLESLLDNYVKEIGNEINKRITVVDSLGNVLADSKKDPKQMENHRNRPELIPVFRGKSQGQSMRFSTTVQDEMIYVALPIYDDDKDFRGAIRVSLFISEIENLTNSLAFQIVRSALIVVLLSLIGVLIFSRTVTKPINQISQASAKVAMGDFDVKVNLSGRDEIKDLGDNFNNMTSRLKDLFSEVSRQKDELNTLIKTIQEGLIAVNTNGTILLANKSFCDIINKYQIIGSNINELFENTDVITIFNRIVQEKLSFTNELAFQNRHFLCSANFIETKKEVVLLFHDITEIKKLEKIKRDFVTNVSHELRTPLTAIKGFVETMEDELEGEFAHYIDIIKRHTNRLISIVQDLMILSELEEPNSRLMLISADIRLLIDNVVKMFEQKLKEKNLTLIINSEDNFPNLKVDVFRIEQVFVNLIDNAIKYSDAGEIKINIFRSEEKAIIEVRDSGKGISLEDQKRIFERFYIVDKSRSRKVGGTGLGLSIVKHIILLHKGDISVSSNPGDGTAFLISLPIQK